MLLPWAIACTSVKAAEAGGDTTYKLEGSVDDFTTKYTAVTKQIMLCGIEMERFSLHYRLEAAKLSNFRRLRYAAFQETAAGGGLSLEIIADKQFGIGRNHPLRISGDKLRDAFTTAGTTAIIGGSGSCLELASNALRAIQNQRHGFDPGSARKFVVTKVKHFDELLQQRDQLVSAHTEHPGYARAVAEGKVLKDLRDAFVDEFSHFHADARAYAAFQNAFFLLNIATNTVSAATARTAYRATTVPRLNGPTNVMFIVAGGMTMVTPWLAAACSRATKWYAYHQFARQINERPQSDALKIMADRRELQALLASSQGSLMPSLPATDRMAIYGESDALFRKQLDSETRVVRYFDKVADASTLLGPAIGGTLMAQGIFGTVGYYDYKFRIRQQINHYYRGAVAGTVGTSMAVVGTPGWLLTTFAYEHHLRKNHQLPVQLIHDRLAHLDELEKTANAL